MKVVSGGVMVSTLEGLYIHVHYMHMIQYMLYLLVCGKDGLIMHIVCIKLGPS